MGGVLVPTEGGEGFLDVEGSWFSGLGVGTIPIVQTVNGIGVLLDFEKEAAGADGMNPSGRHIEKVTWVWVDGLEPFGKGAGGKGCAEVGRRCAGFESQIAEGIRGGVEHVPAFGFGFAAEATGGVGVGVNLNAEGLSGVEDLNQKGESGGWVADEFDGVVADEALKRLSIKGSAFDAAHAIWAIGDFPRLGAAGKGR